MPMPKMLLGWTRKRGEKEMKPSYTVFRCPHCKKFVGANLFRLQDLNKANRARFTAEEERKKEAAKE